LQAAVALLKQIQQFLIQLVYLAWAALALAQEELQVKLLV
jgi:hypothetical protein